MTRLLFGKAINGWWLVSEVEDSISKKFVMGKEESYEDRKMGNRNFAVNLREIG